MGIFKTALYSALIIGSGFGGYQVTSKFTEEYFKSLQEANLRIIEQSQRSGLRGVSDVSVTPLPTRKIDTLVVNTTNTERTYANKSEQEGVMDLQRLVTQTEYEESWVYIPQEQKWVEVGKEEYNQKDKKSVTLDSAIMNSLLQQYDSLVFYHIHPYTQLELTQVKQEMLVNYTRILSPQVLEQITRNVWGGFYVFPSANDLIEMVTTSRKFYGQHPIGDISHKIVSSFGVTEYKLTNKGKELFFLNAAQLKQVMELTSETSNTYMERMRNTINVLSSHWAVQQAAATCQDMSTSHYIVRFKPFEQKADEVVKPLLYKTKKKGNK